MSSYQKDITRPDSQTVVHQSTDRYEIAALLLNGFEYIGEETDSRGRLLFGVEGDADEMAAIVQQFRLRQIEGNIRQYNDNVYYLTQRLHEYKDRRIAE